MQTKGIKKYIGDKKFYKMLLLLVIPLIVQQGITNFVSLLDNLMVGSLGTEQMSGVAIVNQLIFVFNLAIFGGLSGVSIFGAQFYGVGDHKGMRHTLRLKLYFGVFMCALALAIFALFGSPLVNLFLSKDANEAASLTATLGYAMDYMRVAVWGLVPFMVVQTYAGTLRETGDTVAPMRASVLAIFVNLIGNWLLIFGNAGFPKMGVAGAALATVIARWLEMLYVVAYSHRSHLKYPFFDGVYSSFYVPASLIKKVLVTGSPLLLNEILWSIGTTFVNQNYSTRGLVVVAGMNITVTAWELFCVIMFAMGNAVSILVGQRLGAGEIEQAKDIDRKLIFFTTVMHVLIGVVIVVAAFFIPQLYNTEPAVKQLATKLLIVAGASLPIHAFIHVAYFTIRSGGKTVITFFFDCVYTWLLPVPLSFILCRFTGLDIVTIYFIIQFSDFIKIFIAVPMLKNGFWANNVIASEVEKDKTLAE